MAEEYELDDELPRREVITSPRERAAQSIDARKQMMYDEEHRPVSSTPAGPSKPFAAYLRETPADPLSTGTKAILWVVGILVVLLFVASLLKGGRKATPPPKTGAATVAAPMLA